MRKTCTSLLIQNGMPDRFVGCITSGQQLLNEHNFNILVYGLLTMCEVKMAGYWLSSFLACVYGPSQSQGP